MIQSFIVYSSLMAIMILFAVLVSKNSSVVTSSDQLVQKSFWRFEILFPLLLFAIIFGMRYDVGWDHIGYLEGYLSKDHVSKGEPLFELISEIGWKLNLHYVIYFSIIAFIQILFFFYAFKEEKYLFPFLVFFLFTNGDWSFWMNGLRQTLAMCIWIYSLKYIEKKLFLSYLIWCIVAFLFHRSAAIMIFFYPILSNGKDYFKCIPLQLLLLAGAFVIKEIFSDLLLRIEPLINTYADIIGGGSYGGYNVRSLQESFRESDGTGLVYIFRLILNVLIIIYSKKLKNYYHSKRFIIIYFFFFIGIIFLYIIPVGAIAIRRPFQYFYTFQMIMYAYFIYYLYKTKKKSFKYGMIHALMYYGILIIFIGIFYFSLVTSDNESHLWYQFYFNQEIYGYPNLSLIK